MSLRPLGSTGLHVSRLGLGLAALGRPGYINLGHRTDLNGDYAEQAMKDRAFAVLDAAWELGIRYFDTARSYGAGEAFLADWLRARGRTSGQLVVGSKWGYTYTAAWRVDAPRHEVKEHSLTAFRRQFSESRALLGTYLNLYQVHSATLDSGLFDDPALLEELARQRDAGLILGITLTGPGQAATLHRALDLEFAGRSLFGCVQATWNVLEPSVGPALAEAHRRGWGVIVKEALANGRLTTRNSEPEFTAKTAVLSRWARKLGATWDALAIATALAQPWANVILSGATTPDQLVSNRGALTLDVPNAAVDELLGLAELPTDYWQTRSRLPWN